ncbi:MAG: FeoB-associated Cys-rich membrane protein [Thermodesulfobacteriota bacterium]
MIQSIIVFLIVGLAVAFTARNLYRSFKGTSTCGCGCSGCADTSGCRGHTGNESTGAAKDP